MVWIFLCILLAILLLLTSEYISHDCVPGKNCTHNCESPKESHTPEEAVDIIRNMVKNNYDYVSWRQALLVALIVLVPIVYFIYESLPDLYEFFIITSIVFIVVYMSSIWSWTHFFYPNGAKVEQSLLELRDKITDKTEEIDLSILDDLSFSFTTS